MPAKDYTYEELRDTIRHMCDEYTFLKAETIGKSVSGRNIYCLKIGDAPEYVLFVGGFGGRERITCTLLLEYARQLCDALKHDKTISHFNARKAMYGRALMIVPQANPDSCEVAIKGATGCGYLAPKIKRLCSGDFSIWNSNLRGVNINHNFDIKFRQVRELEKSRGIYGPCPEGFAGPFPVSEPETEALVKLCASHRIRHALAFRTGGESIYWSFEDIRPDDSERMAELLSISAGYSMEVPTGLMGDIGFKDFILSQYNRPALTVYVGKGDPTILQFPKLYDRLLELLVLATLM
ncbi:MAG TPA: hypothetical protein GXX17_01505 [Clostridiales bacterium]|nr:hypothetical protein [Clostridiales bacterium]